jgi:hydrogenase expression/formation protein HypC
MKIRSIDGDFAKVESARLIRTVNIQMLPSLSIGDSVIVHAGFAIEKLDVKRALETLRLIDEIH